MLCSASFIDLKHLKQKRLTPSSFLNLSNCIQIIPNSKKQKSTKMHTSKEITRK